VSGIESGQSQDRSLSYRDRALGLTVGSALLWLIAAAVIVTDASVRDEIPDSVSSGLCALAGTATIGAMMSWTRAASSEMFGLLAAEVEQVSTRPVPLAQAPDGDAVRRISRESFELGRRVQRNHADENSS
jgi:hypothetical protein